MITEKEFAEIVGRTKGTVLSAIEHNLSERFYHAIDDVVQETYLRAYRSLVSNKFRGESSLSTWLYAIASNESRRMNKKLEREEKKFQKSVERMEETLTGEDRDKEGIIQEIYDAINNLPDKYKSVMDLVSKGYTVKQIADKLKIKKGTVKSRTFRSREILQKMIRGGGQ